MKNKVGILIVALGLAATILLAIVSPGLMISPGKPIDAHAGFATDCFACHTPFLGSTPEKCIACHKVKEIGLQTTKGLSIAKEKKNVTFHQKLIETDCVSCHSDHKGVKSFRPIHRFSHNLLEPSLQKRCENCHGIPGDALHLKVKGNCALCHTQGAWFPATFNHEKLFRFDRHHKAECAVCHVGNDYDGFTCYGCHEHSRSKIREEHLEEGIREYERCVECHRSGDEDEAKRLWRSRRDGGSHINRPESHHDDHDGHDDHDEHEERDDH